MLVTLSTLGRTGGERKVPRRIPLGTIMSSWVLEGLRRRLLELAQEDKCNSSAGRPKELEDGAIRKTSSAYLIKTLLGISWWRSEALIMKAIGPRAEPWITLAEMEYGLDMVPLNLVWWECLLKQL